MDATAVSTALVPATVGTYNWDLTSFVQGWVADANDLFPVGDREPRHRHPRRG